MTRGTQDRTSIPAAPSPLRLLPSRLRLVLSLSSSLRALARRPPSVLNSSPQCVPSYPFADVSVGANGASNSSIILLLLALQVLSLRPIFHGGSLDAAAERVADLTVYQ